MAGYSKLWSTIITSSVWSEDNTTRIMWITMLALAEADGHVPGAIPGMAAVARMSIEDAQSAIDRLCAPDRYSRCTEADGRRLIPVPGGWQIINYAKYRAGRDEDERREYIREYMRRRRAKEKNVNNPVNNVNKCKPPYAQAEAEAEAEAKKEPPIIPQRGKRVSKFTEPSLDEFRAYVDANPELRHLDTEDIWKGYHDGGWIDTQGKPVRNWKLKLRTLAKFKSDIAHNRRSSDPTLSNGEEYNFDLVTHPATEEEERELCERMGWPYP